MLSEVEVITARVAETLRLPMQDPESEFSQLNYLVEQISGLEPVDADITTSSFALEDGFTVSGSRIDGRNIVITLGYNTDYATNTVQVLREKLYKYFMPKTEVTLRFYDTERAPREIQGIVETFQSPIFVSEPLAQVSILCPQPAFYAVDSFVDALVDTWHDTTPLGTTWEIDYQGSVESGIQLFLKAETIINGFRLEIRSETMPVQQLEFTGTLLVNTAADINTVPGQRAIQVIDSNNTATSALSQVSLSSVWPMLYPGRNQIRVYSVGEVNQYQFLWREQYGGL